MTEPPERKPFESHLGEMPVPRAHRPTDQPEERTASHAKDILASVGSGALILGAVLLLAWLLYSLAY